MKILIVDDNPVDREYLTKVIVNMGFPAVSTGDVRGLSKSIENLKPDLVVLDIHMPEKSGLQIAEELSKSNPEIAIMLVSGSAELGHKIQAFELGALKYLEKPVDLKLLSSALSQYELFLRVKNF